jgi:hypothetical protein
VASCRYGHGPRADPPPCAAGGGRSTGLEVLDQGGGVPVLPALLR